METFKLYIDTSNAAFDGRAKKWETARILRGVADALLRGESFAHYSTLFDINGNDVGRAAFKKKGE